MGARFLVRALGRADLVSVDRILLLDDRAEVELRYWCGSLCAVFLTYEAVPDHNGWTIRRHHRRHRNVLSARRG